MYRDIDIFQDGGAAQRDFLDKAVEGYEENVPLLAQIAAGFTPPGVAMDIAAAGKYGRDAYRDFSQGELGSAAMKLGIAGLSGLAAIPVVGELTRFGKEPLKRALMPAVRKGIGGLGETSSRENLTFVQRELFDQKHSTIGKAHKMRSVAVKLAPEFNQQIDNLARQLDLKTTIPESIGKMGKHGEPLGTIKQVPRIVEKTDTKYKGDISKITDSLRTRVVIKTPAEEEAFVNLMKKNYKVFDKGRKIKPEGFVDRKLNIQFTGSDGETLVAEIGVITEPMWKAVNKTHLAYEEFRSVFPKGLPDNVDDLAKLNREARTKGKILVEEMQSIFGQAKKEIDPRFYDQDIKKFASGGYVTAGSSGKPSPMPPNLFSKFVLDISEPSIKKSATCLGVASIQLDSPGVMKNPISPFSTGSNTAGPSSQVKYNVLNSSIDSSLQKFINNYNPKNINIFEVE